MLNQCQFIGNLGADPEVRTFQNGSKVCNLRLAVTEKWTKDGERKERTEWVTVAIFSDGLVGVAERYLKKGSKVFISGKMQTRKWQDKNGADRYSTEIVLQGFDAKLVMLDGPSNGTNGYDRGSSSDPDAPSSHGGYDQSPATTNSAGSVSAYLEDDVPFSFEWRI